MISFVFPSWIIRNLILYSIVSFLRSSKQFGGKDLEGDMTAEMIRKQMTDHEWQTIYKMTKDKNLYQNLINSIFPTIHGKNQIVRLFMNYTLTLLHRW